MKGVLRLINVLKDQHLLVRELLSGEACVRVCMCSVKLYLMHRFP